MKYCAVLLISLLFLFSGLYAQAEELRVEAAPVSGSGQDVEIVLSIDLNSALRNGMMLELPADMIVIPVSLSINGRNVWLQNILSLPERDSVVAWQKVPQGLMFVAKSQTFRSGDEFRLKCITNFSGMAAETAEVRLKEIVSQPDGLKVSADVVAAAQIPQISNR